MTPAEAEFDNQVHLCYEDVRVDSQLNPSYIQVTLKASKTDPYMQGITVYMGRTYNELCPVIVVIIKHRYMCVIVVTWVYIIHTHVRME